MENRKLQFHPINMLKTIAMLIDKQYVHADEHYILLKQAENKPHVLDNAAVDRSIKQYEREKEYIEYYNKQIFLWKKEELTGFQKEEVIRLESQMIKNENIINDILNLAKELRKGTIDEVLGMNDIELIMKYFKDK